MKENIQPQIPRKKISEIILRLKLEPQIREIYVEGLFDRDFYREALKVLGVDDVQVYPIETVEITSDLLIQNGLTEGARQRVQAAAAQFEASKEIHRQVLFLIDADLDYLLDEPRPNPPLFRTEGTSIELILWDKRVLERFFEIALARQAAGDDVSKAMPFVENIVSEIFLFRAAKQKTQKNWKIIKTDESFSAKEEFSLSKYCDKISSKNAAFSEMRLEVIPAINELREKASQLALNKKRHGHDLIAALTKRLKILGFKNFCLEDPDEFARLLMASLDWGMIKSDSTLQMLSSAFPPVNRNGKREFGAISPATSR